MSIPSSNFEYQNVKRNINNSNGCGVDYIEQIQFKALNSLAVNHPYLQAIANGDVADIELALKDFAYQYGLYTAHFTKYVSAVIKNTTDQAHKAILVENLEEELGNVHDVDLPQDVLATVVDQPHTKLFQRFQKALDVDPSCSENMPPCNAGTDWSNQFLRLCEMNQYVGVGALGIGTEFIVSTIYQKILQGIKEHTDLKPQEHVFFDLHSECDDEHAEQIIQITEDLLAAPGAAEQIEYGVVKALELRATFWDAMLHRIEQLQPSAEQIMV